MLINKREESFLKKTDMNVIVCRGITKKGSACKYKAYKNEDYCRVHMKTCLNFSEECSICMEACTNKRESIETKCKHVFHKKCLKKWESSECCGFRTCPNCRSNIFEDKVLLKLKADKLNYLLCLRWIFITITSPVHLTAEEVHVQISNERKYLKMVEKSPGLQEIYNVWGSGGTKSDEEFFLEKYNIDVEVAVLYSTRT